MIVYDHVSPAVPVTVPVLELKAADGVYPAVESAHTVSLPTIRAHSRSIDLSNSFFIIDINIIVSKH